MEANHDLLIAAVTASIMYFFRLIWKWKTGDTAPNSITIYGAIAVGFGLYGLEAAYPWIFGDQVVAWFMKAMNVPALIGIVFEAMKKANPKIDPPVVQDAGN